MRTRIAGGSVFRTDSVLNGVNPHKHKQKPRSGNSEVFTFLRATLIRNSAFGKYILSLVINKYNSFSVHPERHSTNFMLYSFPLFLFKKHFGYG